MKDEDKKTLQISRAEFEAALRLLDKYLEVEFHEMPPDFPTWNSYDNAQGHSCPADVALTLNKSLFELRDFLWKAFSAPKEVDEIHAALFAKEQVEFFKGLYATVEDVAPRARKDRYDGGGLESPIMMFLKLSKPAQMMLVSDDLLNKAMKIWHAADDMNDEAEYEAEAAEEKRKEEAKALRAERRAQKAK